MNVPTADTGVDFDNLILDAEKLCERRNPQAQAVIARAAAMLVPGNTRQAALLEYINAFCECFVRNNYDVAIQRLGASLAAMDVSLHDEVGYKLLMTLGNAHQLKGDLFSAQESYLAGLKTLSFKRADLSNVEKNFFAAFYYNLATLLNGSELDAEAEDYLQQAINMYKEIGNKFKLSQCYVAYAQKLEAKENYTGAMDYLNRALAIGNELNDAYSIALATANLGVICIKAEQPQKALEHFGGAMLYYEGNNMPYETALLKIEMARAYQHTGNYTQALQTITAAQALMLNLDNKKELSEIYCLKASILTALQKHAEANGYLRKYIDTLKFFYDSEKNNALTRAKKEFEWEQKENEARLLREKNNEIKRYADKLEISNNELKQFASVASHDLKEPLRMISGYIYLLRKSLDGNATPEQDEFCSYAMDGARRMEGMIQDLLRLARVDADARIEKVNLQNVVEEVKLNLRALIKERHATITATGLPLLLADRTQMLQLFQNLISNGINYNNSAAPTVQMECKQTPEELCITITDNGMGIPDYFKESAFQIFKTMPNNTGTKGTGIGLTICKKIVEKMQGKIIIEDAPGGGTRFKITFGKEVMVG